MLLIDYSKSHFGSSEVFSKFYNALPLTEKFYTEKHKVRHVGFKNIKIKYKYGNREMNEKEECNLEVSFDDTFKIENHLSIVSMTNEMIGSIVRNVISRKDKVFWRYIKPL